MFEKSYFDELGTNKHNEANTSPSIGSCINDSNTIVNIKDKIKRSHNHLTERSVVSAAIVKEANAMKYEKYILTKERSLEDEILLCKFDGK